MKCMKTLSAVSMILASLLAFRTGTASADEAWRYKMEDQRRRAILAELTRVAHAEMDRARQSVGSVNQTGKSSDPTWRGRMSANAAASMRQYDRAIQAFVNLQNEANAYLQWSVTASRFVYIETFHARNTIQACTERIQMLRIEMNRNRTFWYSLGLQF